WVRLEVPASALGLENASIQGMSFSLYGGRATFDKTGKAGASAGTSTASGSSSSAATVTTVAIAAADSSIAIGGQDNATLTFTRTGDTSAALLVKFALGGSAVKWLDYRRPEGDMPVEITIPAGSSS